MTIKEFDLDKIGEMSRIEIEDYKLKKLQEICEYAYENTEFYREKFDGAGVKPEDINELEDITKIPITTKQEIAESEEADPPYGKHLACDPKEVVRVNLSPGVKGRAIEPRTREDCKLVAENQGFAFKVMGIDENDTLAITARFSYLPAGTYLQSGGERVGAATIPAGVGNREALIEVLKKMQVTALQAFTTYTIQIGEKAKEMGIDPEKDLNLQKINIGGEPGGGVEKVRNEIKDIYGDVDLYEVYGTAEGSISALECDAHEGFHVVEPWNEVEVLDKDTKRPVKEGEEGVIAITNFHMKAFPLIRFWTDDLTEYNTEKCDCGLEFNRIMGILGKAGDIVRAKGVLLYPASITSATKDNSEIGEYQLFVTREGGSDRIKVNVAWDGQPSEKERKKIEKALTTAMDLRPDEINYVSPDEIPENAFMNRIVDERKDVYTD